MAEDTKATTATIALSGKDCAIVFRETGQIEFVMKPRPENCQKLDLSYGELLLAMFSSLLQNKVWVDKTIEDFNSNRFGVNL
jgi:hypothetical protein